MNYIIDTTDALLRRQERIGDLVKKVGSIPETALSRADASSVIGYLTAVQDEIGHEITCRTSNKTPEAVSLPAPSSPISDEVLDAAVRIFGRKLTGAGRPGRDAIK